MGAHQSSLTGGPGEDAGCPVLASGANDVDALSVKAHAIDCGSSIASSFQSISDLDDFFKPGDSAVARRSRPLATVSGLLNDTIVEGDELRVVYEDREYDTHAAPPGSDVVRPPRETPSDTPPQPVQPEAIQTLDGVAAEREPFAPGSGSGDTKQVPCNAQLADDDAQFPVGGAGTPSSGGPAALVAISDASESMPPAPLPAQTIAVQTAAPSEATVAAPTTTVASNAAELLVNMPEAPSASMAADGPMAGAAASGTTRGDTAVPHEQPLPTAPLAASVMAVVGTVAALADQPLSVEDGMSKRMDTALDTEAARAPLQPTTAATISHVTKAPLAPSNATNETDPESIGSTSAATTALAAPMEAWDKGSVKAGDKGKGDASAAAEATVQLTSMEAAVEVEPSAVAHTDPKEVEPKGGSEAPTATAVMAKATGAAAVAATESAANEAKTAVPSADRTEAAKVAAANGALDLQLDGAGSVDSSPADNASVMAAVAAAAKQDGVNEAAVEAPVAAEVLQIEKPATEVNGTAAALEARVATHGSVSKAVATTPSFEEPKQEPRVGDEVEKAADAVVVAATVRRAIAAITASAAVEATLAVVDKVNGVKHSASAPGASNHAQVPVMDSAAASACIQDNKPAHGKEDMQPPTPAAAAALQSPTPHPSLQPAEWLKSHRVMVEDTYVSDEDESMSPQQKSALGSRMGTPDTVSYVPRGSTDDATSPGRGGSARTSRKLVMDGANVGHKNVADVAARSMEASATDAVAKHGGSGAPAVDDDSMPPSSNDSNKLYTEGTPATKVKQNDNSPATAPKKGLMSCFACFSA